MTSVLVGAGVGVGVGAGAGGLLIVMLPPVPGETISSAPQLANASALVPRTSVRKRIVTGSGPLKKPDENVSRTLIATRPLGLLRDSLCPSVTLRLQNRTNGSGGLKSGRFTVSDR